MAQDFLIAPATARPLGGHAPGEALSTSERVRIVLGSTIGTSFEFYEFLLYSALAPYIAKNFFGNFGPTIGYIVALLAFAAGFVVRPLGAVVFGRLGDRLGRKYTFLATVTIMGVATILVGVLPPYSAIGLAAPALLIALRMLQGLALGGEYGGAAVYVAEHAPANRRNTFTAWLQAASTLGLLMSLIVVAACRSLLSAEQFDAWGWRLPFLVSALILAVSVWLRVSLQESPLFEKMRKAGAQSRSPLRESFGQWKNLRLVLIAMFGVCAGMGVIWFVAQIYALTFLTRVLKMDPQAAGIVMAVALAAGLPVYFLVGRISDRVGRKPVIVAGCVLAAFTMIPVFKGITHYVNPALERAQRDQPVVVTVPRETCSLQFNPIGTAAFTSTCDVARAALNRRGIPYTNHYGSSDAPAVITVGTASIAASDEASATPLERAKQFDATLDAALERAGYPTAADPAEIDYPVVTLLLFFLVACAAITYSPTAAALVEMFPTRIRYTSVSLPYHLGVGWFGGFVPAVAVAIQVSTGNLYDGLIYPLVVIALSVVVAALFLRETKGRDLEDIQ